MAPSRANEHHSVKRKLNFAVDDLGSQNARAAERGFPQKRPAAQKLATKSASQSITSGKLSSPKLKPVFHSNNGSDYERDESYQTEMYDDEGDFYRIVNGDDGHNAEAEQYEDGSGGDEEAANGTLEAEPDSSLLRAAKKRGRLPMAKATAAKKAKGRPPRSNEGPAHVENDVEETEVAEVDREERPAKKQRSQAKKSATAKSEPQRSRKPAIQKYKSTVAKPNSSPMNISSPAVVQRGPPRPKNSRGLYILRRETPDNSSHTRSGRHVIKPLAYWKNETVVYGEDQAVDGDTNFLLPTIKEVIRAEEVEEEHPKRGAKKSASKSKKRRQVTDPEEDGEDLAEPWESEPGRIYGEVRVWDPEDILGDMSEEVEEEIALSSAAIITTYIPGTTVRFAKTLTLPFFGSGMVDLPPGGIKKTKNSRRMQMVFFVFYGRVNVTVNGNAFRIGKGGMWQVPRGRVPVFRHGLCFLTSFQGISIASKMTMTSLPEYFSHRVARGNRRRTKNSNERRAIYENRNCAF
jgi:centromere protein C